MPRRRMFATTVSGETLTAPLVKIQGPSFQPTVRKVGLLLSAHSAVFRCLSQGFIKLNNISFWIIYLHVCYTKIEN